MPIKPNRTRLRMVPSKTRVDAGHRTGGVGGERTRRFDATDLPVPVDLPYTETERDETSSQAAAPARLSGRLRRVLHECYHGVMQLTLRISERVAIQVKKAAGERGQSVNRWISDVLSAAVDPDFAGDEAERVRERLARAGLLMPTSEPRSKRPSRRRVAKARDAAGRGTSLSDLVGENRR